VTTAEAEVVPAELDPKYILATIERLHRRTSERFPDASLARVVGGLVETARSAMHRAAMLRRPNVGLRALAILLILAALVLLFEELRILAVSEGAELVQTVDAAVSTLVYVGVAVFFVTTLETRIKRSRVLVGLHQLRSVAHIVDMHQLTKDPPSVRRLEPTASSPPRALTDRELERYYDYCSEALSLVSKVAAVHAQQLNDPVVLSAVDEIEMLCTGLSNKIWQKVMLIPRADAGRSADRSP
jgi:hypothetical protein